MELTLYKTQEKAKGAIIICPGGGYRYLSDREGEKMAKRFTAMGFHCFVVMYTTRGDDREEILLKKPLFDLTRALIEVKKQSQDLGFSSENIFIMGFSAGGHVAATYGVHYNSPELKEAFPDADLGFKGLILGYPVITMGTYGHEGSTKNLIGENPDQAIQEWMSCELQVHPGVPPTFIWHTVTDQSVPIENSWMFVKALNAQHIPTCFYQYPEGVHGMALADETTATGPQNINALVAQWPVTCEIWMNQILNQD